MRRKSRKRVFGNSPLRPVQNAHISHKSPALVKLPLGKHRTVTVGKSSRACQHYSSTFHNGACENSKNCSLKTYIPKLFSILLIFSKRKVIEIVPVKNFLQQEQELFNYSFVTSKSANSNQRKTITTISSHHNSE